VTSAEVGRFGSIPRTAAQTRVLIAALDLFAEHGVSGTSLQMIADRTGPETLVQAAMVLGAIGNAVKHPLVAGLDDSTLRMHLLRLTRRMVELPA
jgi:hypothetical protein